MVSWLDPVNNWDIFGLLETMTSIGAKIYDAFGNLVAFFGTPMSKWFGDKWAEITEEFPDLSGGFIGIVVRYFTGDDSFSVTNLSIWDLITTAVVIVVLYTFVKWIVGIITG